MTCSRVVSVSLAVLCGASSAVAQELVREDLGANPGDAFGTMVSSGADLDGDGVTELLVTTDWAVEVRSGATGTLLWLHFDDGSGSFGGGTAFVGDVDGDGAADYVCDSPDVSAATHFAYLYSGANGGLLRSVTLTAAADVYAPQVRALGDVNDDDVPDFAVSSCSVGGGAVDVVSGAAGTILHTIAATKTWWAEDVAVVPDLDGDGADDLAIGESANVTKHGALWIHSSKDGALLDEFDGQRGEFFGASVARLHDVDGDGIDELMVGAVKASGGAPRYGAVYVYSGMSHSVRYRLIGGPLGASFGRYLEDAGDVNGDGVHDIAVAAPWVLGGSPSWSGPGHLFSGATGGELYRFEFAPGSTWSGDGFAAMGDVDGDGLGDLAIGDSEAEAVPAGAGRIRIFGGNDLYLLATPRAAAAGWPLELSTREGTTSQLVVTFVMAVDGVPVVAAITPVGSFDATGEFSLSDTVPPGLAGHDIAFLSFAQRAGRGVRASAPETIKFQ